MALALDDIKVLDFTWHFAGPFCTMLLRDLGAEIIKVEIPEGGDGTRGIPPFTPGLESSPFINLNRGKKSITLNLASEKGLQIARDLVKRVDVVVENFTPGVMNRFGLGYEELSKLNPKLIYAASCGFGRTGPRSSEPSFDGIAQARGGMVSINGFPDTPPAKVSMAMGDYLAGFYLTVAILGALHHRSKTGEGQMIDISMQDAIWAIVAIEYSGMYFLNNEIPPRMGNCFSGGAPDYILPAKDGYIVTTQGTLVQWDNFLRVIGREDLIGDEKYATTAERAKRRDEVNALVKERTRTMTVEELLSKLRDFRVPCAPLPTFDQVANDPQLLTREMIVEVEQPISGKVKAPGSVFKMSRTPGDVRFPSPFLGEHNFEVYSGILGYSEEEIRKLADEGVI